MARITFWENKYITQKFIYLFSVLHHALYLIGYITTGSWKGGGNQYIQLVSRFCTVNC